LAALGALARFHRHRFRVPVGAVTGSNGKTTTKELVAAILATRGPALKTQGNLNNEVGLPQTLFGFLPSHVSAVVELGMNHAGEIGRLTAIADPDAGLITSIQPAHLLGLGSIEGVANAKGELFRGLRSEATAVVNADDPRVVDQAKLVLCRKLTYGRAAQADVRLTRVEPQGTKGQQLGIAYRGQEYAVALSLLGAHNALNAAGAFALAVALGLRPEECVAGLGSATAHTRRLEVGKTAAGVTVIDDCYNANPASMAAALATLADLAVGGRGVAVLGDMLELGLEEENAHAELGALAAKSAGRVAFFGPRTKGSLKAASSLGDAARHFDDVEPLVAWLQQSLTAADVVLVKGSRGMRLERVVDALLPPKDSQSSGGGH
jgi:UDP-N-acetylmuramoyl-tripeptide--D-alanyl-D-alanine ligase